MPAAKYVFQISFFLIRKCVPYFNDWCFKIWKGMTLVAVKNCTRKETMKIKFVKMSVQFFSFSLFHWEIIIIICKIQNFLPVLVQDIELGYKQIF